TIPSGISLRSIGAQPLVVRVTGSCTIDGDGNTPSLDGSGFPGRWSDPIGSAGGAGGAGGPGGGAGGDGGLATTAATENGEDCPLDFLPPGVTFTPTSGSSTLPPLLVTPARGGATVSASGSLEPAGSAGGGGHSTSGQAGTVLGGSPHGSIFFLDPDTGADYLFGGMGGGGGGGHIDVAPGAAYSSTPGTGGGGGGGMIALAIGGNFVLTPGGSIVSQGGDAFRAPSLGGNGGAGAGGGVRVRVFGSAEVRGRIDTAGGIANSVPPPVAGYDDNGTSAAGNGSAGRIRLESTGGFSTDTAILPEALLGVYRGADRDRTTARSLPYPVDTAGRVRSSSSPTFAPIVLSGASVPFGTGATLLWEGAPESEDLPGRPGPFAGPVQDPNELDDAAFIRALWFIDTDRTTGASPTIDGFELDFEL
ncbi:MAG: hypothetical protein KDC38_19785, partial [Planctomycetes bacterium]|nr:hypothetical protein [Planctomycetota bacterium]